jgi:orotidine-5'-phosphate decarboxylase
MPTTERALLLSSFGQRLLEVFDTKGQLCVGLDPSAEQLSKWELPLSASGAEKFCNKVLDACHDSVGIVKPQVAFFEQFGSGGLASLERILLRASEEGFLVIADAKRGDIGSTMDGYARAWLSSEAPFVADALTVSPFLGPESLGDTVTAALQNGKGLFILAATSNPEARSLQSSTGGLGQSVSSDVCEFAGRFSEDSLGSIGVVIGAQVNLNLMGIDSAKLSSVPILAPGFGAQGAQLSSAKATFGQLSPSVVFNVARSVAGNSADGLKSRVLAAKLELETGLSQ